MQKNFKLLLKGIEYLRWGTSMTEVRKAGQAYLVTTSSNNNTFTNIWKELWDYFFVKFEDNLTDPKSRNVKWFWSSYPENIINKQTSEEKIRDMYPLIVINPIDVEEDEKSSFGVTTRNPTLRIDLYCDNPNHLDSLTNDINNIIDNNKTDLLDKHNISNITLVSSSYTPELRESIRIHTRELIYSMESET